MMVMVVGRKEMDGNGRNAKNDDGRRDRWRLTRHRKSRAWSTRLRGDGGEKEREEGNVRREIW